MSKLQAIRKSTRLFGLLALIVIVGGPCGAKAQGAVSPTLQRLLAPPADSADAENVRIWLGRERRNTCRVTIDIFDDSGRVVRHLLDEVLPWGYYNFYWDKKDDSGRFVPAGEYPYRIDNCGINKEGSVKAGYRGGEAAFDIFPEQPDRPGLVLFDIYRDSVLVSWMITSPGGRVVDTIAVDSLMNSGHYEFQWAPAGPAEPGLLRLTMTVGGFSRQTTIRRPL